MIGNMLGCGTPEHGHRIAQASGCIYNPVSDISIVRVLDGELLGGAIFKSYTGASVNMHFAGFRKNWMCREHIERCFEYVFETLGCKKVFVTIPSTNKKTLAMAARFGFTLEVTIRDVFPDSDMLVLAMYRAQCRWLRPRSTDVR